MKGWELLCFCLGSFAATQEFSGFLTKYVDDMSKNMADEGLQYAANICMEKMRDVMFKGGRKKPPSEAEFIAVKKELAKVCSIKA